MLLHVLYVRSKNRAELWSYLRTLHEHYGPILSEEVQGRVDGRHAVRRAPNASKVVFVLEACALHSTSHGHTRLVGNVKT